MSDDMKGVITPKSDQLNADDLITGPMTVRIADVQIRGGQEQPISVSYEGDGGKPYKPCKSMCRVMVSAWGADSSKYAGRSMTLYRDPKVRWGGMEVGGIRISHMSDIAESLVLALTMSKTNRKPYTVQPLKAGAPKSAPSQSRTLATDTSVSAAITTATGADHKAAPKPNQAAQKGQAKENEETGSHAPGSTSDAAPTISADEALALEARINENNIELAKVKKFFKVERLSLMSRSQLVKAHEMIDTTIAERHA